MRTLIIDSRIRSWETSLVPLSVSSNCSLGLSRGLLHKDGLPLLPDKMKGAMQSYVADNDPLQDFLSADCELGAVYEVMTTVFHAKFKSKHPRTDKQLIKWMQDKGFDKRQSRSPSFPARAMAWQGVCNREIHQDLYQNVQLVMDLDDEH